MSPVHDNTERPRVPHRIETERLVLRCYEPADATALQATCARNREHLLPWLPWAEQDPQTLDEKLELVLSFRSKYDAGENSVMGIFESESGELVGGTGLHPCGGEGPQFTREIGYWIAAEREGRGYVSEAVRALLLVAFRHVGLLSIVVRCDPENARSRAVPERLGFVNEGLLRNTIHRANGDLAAAYRYCMTRREYEASEAFRSWCEGPDAVRLFDALGRRLPLRCPREFSRESEPKGESRIGDEPGA